MVKNDTKIKVFIDKILNGEFIVKNDESGTANFAYKPFVPLSSGNHLVYVTAIDDRGKESFWSNIIYFNVGSEPAASSTIASKEQKITEKPIVKGDEADFNTLDSAKENLNNDQKEKTESGLDLSEIEEILDADQKGSEKISGAINESQKQQGKLNVNLIIFIAFLFAIIVWIFWVNRELIKERQEEDSKNKK